MSKVRSYLIITPFFPKENSHVGSYVYDQAKTIQEQSNYHVEVIKVVGLTSSETDYIFKGITVHIFKILDLPFFIFPGIFNIINNIRIRYFVKSHFICKDLVIVHAHVCYPSAYLANALSAKFQVKTIVQHHGIDALQLLNGRFPVITRCQNVYFRKRSINQLNRIDLNVSVSKRIQNDLYLNDDYKPRSEYVLYNGVDRHKFYPMKVSKANDSFAIGCVANFWPIKDHISLIKAIGLLKEAGFENINLRLIGAGETHMFCKNYVIDHNLEDYVTFENERDHEKLNQFYNEISLFVMPSYYEALGCVLLEAWATNTPVISIKNQGIEEILPKNELDFLLAERQNPESLKEKIVGEYNRKRDLVFDDRYDIRNTIIDFLKQSIFENGK